MIYLALSFLSLCAEEILSTKEGGVIQVGDVRLQGREVTLSKENGEDILHIKGDVLVVQNKKFLIGEELTYNMSKKEGTLTNGTYFVDKYFLGGKKITLSETGALQIEEGYATTSPDKEFPWAVQAKQINLSETSRMQATEIKPSAFNTPFFFLPSYSMALQKDPNRPEPPFQYQFAWESGQGLTTLRSKLMDLSGWKLYGRGEYRIMRGGGAALDLTYKPKEKSPYTFEANNFCAYDTFAKGPSW